MKPTILISLIKDTPRRFPGRRPQPWRYIVKDAGNGAFYEKSTENLTNRGDAVQAIVDVHGPQATVIVRQEGHPDWVVREPATRRIELSDAERTAVVRALWGANADHPDLFGTVEQVITAVNDVIAPQPLPYMQHEGGER